MYVSLVDPVEGKAVLTSDGMLLVKLLDTISANAVVSGSVAIDGTVEAVPANSAAVAYGQEDVDDDGMQVSGEVARTGFMITNMDDTVTVFVGVGTTAATATTGYAILPNGSWALPPGVTTGERITVITATGQSARISWMQF